MFKNFVYLNLCTRLWLGAIIIDEQIFWQGDLQTQGGYSDNFTHT